jgi:hypothetical protein
LVFSSICGTVITDLVPDSREMIQVILLTGGHYDYWKLLCQHPKRKLLKARAYIPRGRVLYDKKINSAGYLQIGAY